MNDKNNKHFLRIVFLTVFIDMVGFSIIFPLYPEMLQYYLGLEGPDGLIGRLMAVLGTVSGEAHSLAVVTLFGGVLGSIYSFLQFLFAPIWGNLSDRIGRRPTLLLTLLGTAASYVLWFFSGSFLLLVGARLLGGIMAGNVATASAVVADTCEGPDRARGMGVLGAGIGLGFVLGPAVGGIGASWNLLDSFPALADYGVNPFSMCALAAFVLASFNLISVYRRLPETFPQDRPAKPDSSEPARTRHPFRILRRLKFPGVRRVNLANFVYLVAFSAMEFTLTFLAAERLGYRARENMWMFVFVGITIAMVQGGLVRRVVPRAGEKRVAVFGIAVSIPGFVLVGMMESSLVLYAGLGLLAVGSGLVMPTLGALVSRYTPDDRQGLALGVFRSLASLARAIGPILGGCLYWGLSSWAPYALGALLVVIALAQASSLPPVGTGAARAGD
ncbi:MAG: MFS transporter [Planctomycetia bacterium]|nr:MAG: MFS transporter [Planctomycetia bacterium]